MTLDVYNLDDVEAGHVAGPMIVASLFENKPMDQIASKIRENLEANSDDFVSLVCGELHAGYTYVI